jgi:predicted MFS family arabinose efflux permease
VRPAGETAQAAGATVRHAVRSRRFMGLYGACLICSFGLFVPFVDLVPYARDHGIAQSSAILLLGTIGVGSTAGRFLLGGLADRMGRLPELAGFAFDVIDSYLVPIAASAGANILAAAIVLGTSKAE